MADPSSRRLEVGGLGLHVEVDGEAHERSLLILHGLTDSSAGFRWLVRRFADRYRVVRFDFRGHGLSDRAEDYVTPDFLDDALAACEQVAGAVTSARIDHETIPGAGHGIHCERDSRGALTEALTTFLSGLD